MRVNKRIHKLEKKVGGRVDDKIYLPVLVQSLRDTEAESNAAIAKHLADHPEDEGKKIIAVCSKTEKSVDTLKDFFGYGRKKSDNGQA